MEEILPLPAFSDLSPSLREFLDQNFRTREHLVNSANLAAELLGQCSELNRSLSDLSRRLSASIADYASHSESVGGVVDRLKIGFSNLNSSSTSVSAADVDGGNGEGSGNCERIAAEELQALAKEVARVETVRSYAEIALKLDSLIGDVEDAVSSSVSRRRNPPATFKIEEKRLLAVKFLKETEDILASVTKSRPQWTHLVSAVDHRVDRALAVLRPQSIADHRALLASLGWPPPLSSSSTEKTSEFPNPLFLMQGDLKDQYRENFLSLCNLQEFQIRRKIRQLADHSVTHALHQPLWAIEELVNPIALASQHHFSKWVGKPEFIFALVYKITRDFVDSMDDILQPLVDKARLVGYSCREEWISAMVSALTTYLAKEVIPSYLVELEEEGTSGVPSHGRDSWLHLIDLMMSFDKRIQSLFTSSGVLFSITEDENRQRISSFSVFCDRPDWLDIWTHIELHDTLDKLKPELDDERSWKKKIQSPLLVSGSEDYNSPFVSGVLLQHLSNLIDRCRLLPNNLLRSRFIRLAAAPVVREFLDRLLHRCQEAEGLTALADDDALRKVTSSINAAHYCEFVLREWCEDVFFLEMASVDANENAMADIGGCIFEIEMEKLNGFQTEWVEKISTVVLRGFDARSRDYVKNKRQWQEKGEEGWTVSKTFVGALDYLQGKTSKLQGDLNEVDFVRVWRNLAGGIDQLIFNSIFMGNAKFYDVGVERLESDLSVLFGVFGAWCVRPEGFFLKLSEGLRILKMKEVQLKEGLQKGKEKWLRQNAIRHLSVAEAEKIMKNRIFMS